MWAQSVVQSSPSIAVFIKVFPVLCREIHITLLLSTYIYIHINMKIKTCFRKQTYLYYLCCVIFFLCYIKNNVCDLFHYWWYSIWRPIIIMRNYQRVRKGLENSHPSFWSLEYEPGTRSCPVRAFQKGALNFYI